MASAGPRYAAVVLAGTADAAQALLDKATAELGTWPHQPTNAHVSLRSNTSRSDLVFGHVGSTLLTGHVPTEPTAVPVPVTLLVQADITPWLAGVADAAPAPPPLVVAFLSVHGMTCHSCVQSVTFVLHDRRGVFLPWVELDAERATVVFDPQLASLADLAETIEDAGFVVDLAESAVLEAAIVRTYQLRAPAAAATIAMAVPLVPAAPGAIAAAVGSANSVGAAGGADTLAWVELDVRGMTCTSCVANIERHLRRKDGCV